MKDTYLNKAITIFTAFLALSLCLLLPMHMPQLARLILLKLHGSILKFSEEKNLAH